jgi:hypothetical protein
MTKLPGISDVRRAPQTLHAAVDGVKVSFIGYEYPALLYRTKKTHKLKGFRIQ